MGNMKHALYQYLDALHPQLGAWYRWLVRAQRDVVHTPQGIFWVDPLSALGQILSQRGEHEAQIGQTLRTYLRAGSVFIDLGAHEGYFTIQASKICGEGGKVYAIEPQERCQEVIGENCRLNACTNVTVLPVAVSDRDGRLKLYLHPATNTGATSAVRLARSALRTVEVRSLTLEALLQENRIEHADLLKIDIEGLEYEAVLGSPDVFRAGLVKAVVVEYHTDILSKRGLDPAVIHEFFLACGYSCEAVDGHSLYTRS